MRRYFKHDTANGTNFKLRWMHDETGVVHNHTGVGEPV